MAKKKEEKVEAEFNLEEAIKEYQKPEWYKRAFLRIMDTSKIKNEKDLAKAFKTFGEMR